MNRLWLRDCKEPKGIALVGNTFPVRVQLRAMGCKWTGLEWRAPEEVAEQAQALVDSQPGVRYAGPGAVPGLLKESGLIK